MSSILSLADSLEPNLALVRGDLRKIADIHVDFYRFYIRFASKCDAFVFGQESRDYLEKCIDYLENKKLTKQGIQQSRSNCLKMIKSLEDLCVNLGVEKKILAGMHKLIDQSVADDDGQGAGTMDLLKQLKNLLNDPGDAINDSSDRNENNGRVSPANSDESSAPEQETSKSSGGVEPMIQYFLSDSGIDSHFHKFNKDVKNLVFVREMNNIAGKCRNLRGNSYGTLDKLFTRLNLTLPIINYTGDRVDSIDSSSVMENPEIFGGNKSVTDAVLHSGPEYLSIGPFDVYVRRTVFVYHCLVFNCNDCVTNSLEYLKLHVKFEHGIHSEIDWNCSSCELIEMHSASQRSLDGALDHLAKYHSIKTTSTLSNERLLEINQSIEKGDLGIVCPKPKSDDQDNHDLFKCPHPNCGFSTNDGNVAFGHFEAIPNQNLVVKCTYCTLESFSIYSLCAHIFNEHGNASYKCGYCSYRTVSKSNCVYHQRDKHSVSAHKILGIEPLPHAQYSYTCRAHNTIKPFVCNSSCNFSTMIEQKFNHHILTHPGMVVTCHYCEKYHTEDMSELRDHFLIHGVGEYRCMYCKEAFNSIFQVQNHLFQSHSSRYPFVIICQDFESRSHSLNGKYQKVQKFEIGNEFIVVLSLDSDIDVISIDVVSQTESILVGDVDHSKMQLKVFLKNKEEPEPLQHIPTTPHIEETLDLTASDDPKERVDIKPRLRVRTIEEIMVSAQEPMRITPENQDLRENQAGYPGIATFHSFTQPDQPAPISEGSMLESSLPILTPTQIKKERFCSPEDQRVVEEMETPAVKEPVERPMTEALIPSVQIKREVVEGNVNKSPKKLRAVKPGVKMEATSTPAISATCQPPTDAPSEDQNAVAALILQEGTGRRGSTSDGEKDRPLMNVTVETARKSLVTPETPMEVEESQAPSDASLTLAGSSNQGDNSGNISLQTESLNNPELPAAPVQTPLTKFVLGADGNINEIIIDQSGNICHQPILSAASIDDVPVDFDCTLPQDTKVFPRDADGNVIPRLQYTDPTVVDTVIISDGEDYGDELTSPESTPSSSRSTTPSVVPTTMTTQLSPNASTMMSPPTPTTSTIARLTQPSSIATLEGNKLKTISMLQKGALQFKVVRPQMVKPQTILIIDPKATSSVRTFPKILPVPQQSTPTLQLIGPSAQAKPSTPTVRGLAAPSSPPIANDVKRFRCKLCQFSSEDRQVTVDHLYTMHPQRFKKQNPATQSARPSPESAIVQAVSCPYCSDVVYEGIKSFERHHLEKHSDFSEVKCFLVYKNTKMTLPQVFACSFCGCFCRNEETVWQHARAFHAAKLANMKKPLALKCTVAMKKMVCPLYNCLDEFLDPSSFKTHVNSHLQVIACKKCTYIADSVEEFQKFHLKIDEHDRVDHFYYKQSKEERANLLNVQRFSNPLYSLSSVFLKEKLPVVPTLEKLPVVPTVKKLTARKSTGGAQYK